MLGAIVESTNSGDSSLLRCVRNAGRHGAAPILAGVWAVVDMVRERARRRRVVVEVAILKSLSGIRKLGDCENRKGRR